MKNLTLLVLCIITVLVGCSRNQEKNESKVHSVSIDLTNKSNLDDWNVTMLPKVDSVGQQVYDLEFQYTGDDPVKDVTVYYRIDTKEKLSGSIIKADTKTVVSNIDKNESIVLSELQLPLNTPISTEVYWLKGSDISEGAGTFTIKELE